MCAVVYWVVGIVMSWSLSGVVLASEACSSEFTPSRLPSAVLGTRQARQARQADYETNQRDWSGVEWSGLGLEWD